MLLFSDVKDHYKTQRAMARALDVSEQYVAQWDKTAPIPELYESRLRYIVCPEVFKKLKSEGLEIKDRP